MFAAFTRGFAMLFAYVVCRRYWGNLGVKYECQGNPFEIDRMCPKVLNLKLL